MITPEAALALRQPFPPESVGKLPKPYRADSPKGNCPECHGYHGLPAVHLDYVGHAAVTDRLLTVDPEWTWEPFALDQMGLPARDQQGNLWIRLTILGTTRIGVGDGKSLKECIGDAIRNAAMRFGMALDLWAKEPLVEFERSVTGQVATPVTAADFIKPDEPAPQPQPQPEPKLSARNRGRLFALFTQKGIPEAEQLAGIARVIGRTPTHRDAINEDEFARVVHQLESLPDAQGGPDA